jgi:hypothetical protein
MIMLAATSGYPAGYRNGAALRGELAAVRRILRAFLDL